MRKILNNSPDSLRTFASAGLVWKNNWWEIITFVVINILWPNISVGGLRSLKAAATEVMPDSRRGGDRLKSLLRRETFWILHLKAVVYPGLNEIIDYSLFL